MTLYPASRPAPPAPPAPFVRRLVGDGRRLAIAASLAIAISSLGSLAAPAPAAAWDGGSFSSASEKQLVALTNRARASAGLPALRVDARLSAIARSRSKDMIVRGYFSHDIPPSGKQVFSIMDAKGYCYAIAGENIGWNTYPDDVATRTVHNQFMDSSGHRRNILGKRWDVIGIGAYKGADGKKMWTVLFADRCGSTSTKAAPRPSPKPKAAPRATPRPTPRPTPVPTPVRTMPPEPSDLLGQRLGPAGRSAAGGDATTGPRRGDDVALVGPTAGRSLRAVDPATAPGLVETIVGEVTGTVLGG